MSGKKKLESRLHDCGPNLFRTSGVTGGKVAIGAVDLVDRAGPEESLGMSIVLLTIDQDVF